MNRLARVVLALSVLGGGACNRGRDDPTVSADGTTSSSTPTTTGGTSTTAFTGAPLPVEAPASATRAHLAAVRVARHDGYDRVVFEFEDAVPGYRVATTTRPVTEDGSGRSVEVEGAVLVEVRMENAARARIVGDRVTMVHKGPDRIGTKGAVVEETVRTGDFEGVVTWVVGLSAAPRGVRVSTLTAPFRLVVDFGAPA